MVVFEVSDETGRNIHLSKERWKHIRKKHPEVEDYEQIKEAIQKPDKIVNYHPDESIYYYYKFFKNRPFPKRYLLVVVKYLNGYGYILSAYFVRTIIK